MQGQDSAWIAWREKFAEMYDYLNYSSRLQSFIMRASHKFIEKTYSDQQHFPRVLEIGAGTGEHFPFVPPYV